MKLPLKTILIDDEPLAVRRLRRLLDRHPGTFDIVAEGANGAEGLSLVERHRPDVIFLDIEMPLLNGFEMLARLNHIPLVIFSTAFDRYAIRAFEENSVDYLLKPVEEARLLKTIEKLKSFAEKRDGTEPMLPGNILKLLDQIRPKKEIFSVSVKSGEKIFLVPLSEIAFFEAEDKYVFLHSADGKRHILSYTLTVLEEKLPAHFLRISRSAIVNSHHIKEIRRHFNGRFILCLSDAKRSQLTSGSTYQERILHLLEL